MARAAQGGSGRVVNDRRTFDGDGDGDGDGSGDGSSTTAPSPMPVAAVEAAVGQRYLGRGTRVEEGTRDRMDRVRR